MQDVNFMGGMPNLDNTTWYNPQTGDKVTIRNTFVEGSDLVLQAADGRMIKYNQFANYIQADAKQIAQMEAERKQKVLEKKEVKESTIPQEILNEIETDDSLEGIDSRLNAEANELLRPHPTPKVESKPLGNIYSAPTQVNLNYEIIQKALNDKPMPKCDVKISWKDCPLENIKALVDMFGISKDELVEYYNSRIDANEIVEKVKKAILNIFTPEEKKEEKKEEPKPVKAEPKKTEPKPIKAEPKKTVAKTKKVKKNNE